MLKKWKKKMWWNMIKEECYNNFSQKFEGKF